MKQKILKLGQNVFLLKLFTINYFELNQNFLLGEHIFL